MSGETVQVLYERRRGCGWRKGGGTYAFGGGFNMDSCCLLPAEVHVCPTCNQGIKPSLGWSWIKPEAVLETPTGCEIDASVQKMYKSWPACPARHLAAGRDPKSGAPLERRCGLLWIGTEHYASPSDFIIEARRMGISRRLPTAPRGFKAGEDWVLLGHRKAIGRHPDYRPGIFLVWQPKELQYVLPKDATAEQVRDLRKRGLVPVIVEELHSGDEDPTNDGAKQIFRVVPEQS